MLLDEMLQHLASFEPNNPGWVKIAELASAKIQESASLQVATGEKLRAVREHRELPYFRNNGIHSNWPDFVTLPWTDQLRGLQLLESMLEALDSLYSERRCSPEQLDFNADTGRMRNILRWRRRVVMLNSSLTSLGSAGEPDCATVIAPETESEGVPEAGVSVAEKLIPEEEEPVIPTVYDAAPAEDNAAPAEEAGADDTSTEMEIASVPAVLLAVPTEEPGEEELQEEGPWEVVDDVAIQEPDAEGTLPALAGQDEPEPRRLPMLEVSRRLQAAFGDPLEAPRAEAALEVSERAVRASVLEYIEQHDWLASWLLTVAAEGKDIAVPFGSRLLEWAAALNLGVSPRQKLAESIEWTYVESLADLVTADQAEQDTDVVLVRLAAGSALWFFGDANVPDEWITTPDGYPELFEFVNAIREYRRFYGPPNEDLLTNTRLRTAALSTMEGAEAKFLDWEAETRDAMHRLEKQQLQSNPGSADTVLALLDQFWQQPIEIVKNRRYENVEAIDDHVEHWRNLSYFGDKFRPIYTRVNDNQRDDLPNHAVWAYFHKIFLQGCQLLQNWTKECQNLSDAGHAEVEFFCEKLEAVRSTAQSASSQLDGRATGGPRHAILALLIKSLHLVHSRLENSQPDTTASWMTAGAETWAHVAGRRLAPYSQVFLEPDGRLEIIRPQKAVIAEALMRGPLDLETRRIGLRERLLRGEIGLASQLFSSQGDQTGSALSELFEDVAQRIKTEIDGALSSFTAGVRRLEDLRCIRGDEKDLLELTLEDLASRRMQDWRSTMAALVNEEEALERRIENERATLQTRWDELRERLRGRTAAEPDRREKLEAVVEDDLRADRFPQVERLLAQIAIVVQDPDIDINRQLNALSSPAVDDHDDISEFTKVHLDIERTLHRDSLDRMAFELCDEDLAPHVEWCIDDGALCEFTDAVRQWRLLRSWAEGRAHPNALPDAVWQVLAYLGFTRTDAVGRGSAVRWADPEAATLPLVAAVTAGGACPVPEFGSLISGNYKLHILTAQPNAESIIANLGETLWPHVVLYLGILSWDQRRRLAYECKDRCNPTIFIDEVVLLYLARFHGSRLSKLFGITVPFSGVNPYVSGEGSIPGSEMFIGRGRMVDTILKKPGYYLVYGGRQMGKSTLLEFISREAIRKPKDFVLCHWVVRKVSMDDIWGSIEEALASRGARKVIILLDEVEDFLESEEKTGSHHLNRLELLVNSGPAAHSVTVVLAGNYHAQRYFKANAAEERFETVRVGPLDVADAAELVIRPLKALGFRFSAHGSGLPGAVQCILGYTIYHAGITQLFLHELVKWLWRKQLAAEVAGSPDTPVGLRFDFPFELREEDIDRFVADDEVQILKRMLDRFRKTVDADKSYRLLFFSLVLAQSESGNLEAWYGIDEVKEILTTQWPDGLRLLQEKGSVERWIHARLLEMAGLGLLLSDSKGDLPGRYRIRGRGVLRLFGGREPMSRELAELRGWLPDAQSDFDQRHEPESGDYAFVSLFPAARCLEMRAEGSRVWTLAACRLAGASHCSSGYHRAIAPGRSLLAIEAPSNIVDPDSWIEKDLQAQPTAARVYYIRQGPTSNGMQLLTSRISKSIELYGGNRRVQAVFLLTPEAMWNWYLELGVDSRRESRSVVPSVRGSRFTENGIASLLAYDGKGRDHAGEVFGITGGWYLAVEDLRRFWKPEGIGCKQAIQAFREGFDPQRYREALDVSQDCNLYSLLQEMAAERTLDIETWDAGSAERRAARLVAEDFCFVESEAEYSLFESNRFVRELLID